MNTPDSFFYFDESGSKGYLKTIPDCNAICIIAGYVLKPSDKERISADLGKIWAKIEGCKNGKCHATEVFKNGNNQQVREEFFRYLYAQDIHIAYNAEFLINVHSKRQPLIELERRAKKARRNKDIRISGENQEQKRNVLLDAMEGLFFCVDAMAHDLGLNKVLMISDNMDKEVFRDEQNELAYLEKGSNYSELVPAYNIITKQKLNATLNVTVQGIDMDIKNIYGITFESDVSNLGFAADIIANSLYYYLNEKIKAFDLRGHSVKEINLRSEEIITDYPLAQKVRTVWGSRFVNSFGIDIGDD